MRTLQGVDVVFDDVQVFLLPPSSYAKWYNSMYTYKNRVRVCGAEEDLSTCDSLIAATFLMFCRSNNSDRNKMMTNSEYVG